MQNSVSDIGFIFLSTHSKPETGAHLRYDMLVSALAEKGYKLWWYTPYRRDFENYKNIIQIQIPSRSYSSLRLIFNVMKVSGKIRLRGTLVVVVFGETTLPAAFLLAKIHNAFLSTGVRSNIVKRHAILIEELAFLHKKIESLKFLIKKYVYQFIYRKADHVTVQNPNAKSTFIRDFRVKDHIVDVIPNHIPESRLTRKCITFSGVRKLLFVGKDTVIKGFDVLVKLGAEYDLPSSITQLTLAGVKEEQSSMLRDSWRYRNKHIKIVHAGFVENINSLLVKQDLLIVPSREDQFPNVILEALSVDLPVIGSDVDGINYILKYSELLFCPDSPESLSKAIYKMCKGNNYLKALDLCRKRRKDLTFEWGDTFLNCFQIRFNKCTHTGA